MPLSEPKRPLKVFLSYASQDKPLVRELSRRLVGEGWIDTWLDEKNLLPGHDWRVKIEEAVEESDIVIICLSSNSVTKEGYVQKELRYAREIALEKPEDSIFLIPLRLNECEVPRGLRFYQWVDYFAEGKDSAYQALVTSLKARHEEKIKLEELERLHKEQIEREKVEREAAEKARLKAAEEEMQRIASEKAERENAERKQKEKELRKASESPISAEFGGKEIKQGIWKSIKDIKPVYWFVVFVALGIFGVVLFNSLNRPSQLPEETPVVIAILTKTIEPTETPEPTLIPTSTLSPTPLPTEITDAKGVRMVLVTEGEFTMGFSAYLAYGFCQTLKTHLINYGYPCTTNDYLHEEHVHKVYVSDYYMDVFEVSNGEYDDCVLAGDCNPPSLNNANRYNNYYSNDSLKDYPVLNVTWNSAKKYCAWRGARLPTEAEWEKAARGADERTFPWGNFNSAYAIYEPVFYSNKANVNLSPGTLKATVPVTSNSGGLSPYGIYNMAGNVAEWVDDWYKFTYYSDSPYENPMGPVTGDYKVIRGGSVNDPDVRTTARVFLEPFNFNSGVGFRCAKDMP